MWKLDYKESWVLKNWCFWTVVLEKTLESPLDCKEIQPVHPKGDHFWVFIERTDVEAETPILWPSDVESWLIGKKPWCWERLRVGGKGDDRGWDGWMASPTQWIWVWVNSGSWWWTGRPGVLWFMGLQRVGHNWATELNWTDTSINIFFTSIHCAIGSGNEKPKLDTWGIQCLPQSLSPFLLPHPCTFTWLIHTHLQVKLFRRGVGEWLQTEH